MMNHNDAHELLAALSLDAVSTGEREAIEFHVAQCPRCQQELDSLREVASAIGNSVESLPEGLWSTISSRIYDVQGAHAAATPPLHLVDVGAPVVALASARTRSQRWASRSLLASIGSIAAVIIVVLAVSLASANQRVHQLSGANADVAAALATPNHTLVDMKSSGISLAQFVVLSDGRGYLVRSHLPTLNAKQTYQLWDIIGGKPISLGLLGPSPRRSTFTIAGVKSSDVLAITVEPARGSIAPTSPVIASSAV